MARTSRDASRTQVKKNNEARDQKERKGGVMGGGKPCVPGFLGVVGPAVCPKGRGIGTPYGEDKA